MPFTPQPFQPVFLTEVWQQLLLPSAHVQVEKRQLQTLGLGAPTQPWLGPKPAAGRSSFALISSLVQGLAAWYWYWGCTGTFSASPSPAVGIAVGSLSPAPGLPALQLGETARGVQWLGSWDRVAQPVSKFDVLCQGAAPGKQALYFFESLGLRLQAGCDNGPTSRFQQLPPSLRGEAGEELEMEWAISDVVTHASNEAEFGESFQVACVAGQDWCALERAWDAPVPCAQALSCVFLLAIDSPPSVSFL